MTWTAHHENAKVKAFLNHWQDKDPHEAILKGKIPASWDKQYIFSQLDGRSRIRRKIPSLAGLGLILPPKRALEQCSSEATALYRRQNFGGKVLLDLTAGFGIDAFFMAPNFEKVILVEQDALLAELLNFNANILGLENVEIINGSAETVIENLDASIDFIYVDPDRRSEGNKRHVLFSESSPDLTKAMGKLEEHAQRILIKSSPMMDFAMAERELGKTSQTHVLAVGSECKELLFEYGKSESDVILTAWWHDNRWRTLIVDEHSKHTSFEFSEPNKYIYDPNPAILKAKAWNYLTEKFSLKLLARETHVLTGPTIMEDFPGRIFEVIEEGDFSTSSLDKIKNQPFVVYLRNTKLTIEDLRSKYGITDGNDDALFVYTNKSNQQLWLKAREYFKTS